MNDEIELLLKESLSLEELVSDALRAEHFLERTQNFFVAYSQEELDESATELAGEYLNLCLEDAGLWGVELGMSFEDFKTSKGSVIEALIYLIKRIINALTEYWNRAVGESSRLYRLANKCREATDKLGDRFPKVPFVDGQHSILRVLAPGEKQLTPPVGLFRELDTSTKKLMGEYVPRIADYAMIVGTGKDAPAPVPKLGTITSLPGKPKVEAVEGTSGVVWALRFEKSRSVPDDRRSRMMTGNREQLRDISGYVASIADEIRNSQAKWDRTKNSLERVLSSIERAGSDGVATAKARRAAYATSKLPREWSAYALQLAYYGVRYVVVSLRQYD